VTYGGRVFLWALFITLVILFSLAAFGYFTGRWDDDTELSLGPPWSKRHAYGLMSAAAQNGAEIKATECMTDEARERVRGIMLDAIDDALHDHIKGLFGVWMKDDRGQPSRASVGARQGLRAHQLSRQAVIAWNPPECPS
jgi:hypothetical protein